MSTCVSPAIRVFTLVFFLGIFSAPSGIQATGMPQTAAPTKVLCSPIDYKILTPNAVGIDCDQDPTVIPDSAGQLVLVSKNGQTNQIITAVQVTRAATQDWLILYWPPSDEANLKPGNNYIFNLQYQVDVRSPVVIPALVIPIDSTETVTLSSPQRSEPLDFLVTSHVAFAVMAKIPAYSQKPKTSPREWPTCTIPSKSKIGPLFTLSAQCSQLISPQFATPPTLGDLKELDLTLVGWQWIRLKSLPDAPIIPATMPTLDVLGGKPTFDPKSRFARQSAPATKDASQFYVNVNYAAGVGTSAAWVLDGKYAPPIKMYDQFTVAPLLLADVGNNTVKGQTYTNTVDLGATASRVFRPGTVLQLLAFSPGATYETDRQFDRANLLATIDSRLFFKGLFDPQDQQSFRLYAKELEKNKAAQLTDITTPLLGYQLDFHAGIETGGALVDTTVHASKGTAKETLPQYSIVRLVPQVHFLLQLWKFSFDESFVGRYLATSENTIVESPTHSLSLQKVQGWKAISVLTNSFALDPQGNFSVTLTFKDGFAPPNYKRVNAVQAGILIKY